MTAALADAPVARIRRAPLGRLLRSELRLIFRRPRTIIGLVGIALVPVIAGLGISIASRSPDNEGPPGVGIAAILEGNGLILPIFSMVLGLSTLMLPLATAMWSADALAGEAANGTLRGLFVAPVSRIRVLGIKAFGVFVVSLTAVVVLAVVGTIAGVIFLGGDSMLTISGSTLGFGPAMGRVALAAGLTLAVLLAVGAVGLAVSASTEHPMVVLAATVGVLIVSGVLGSISALDWLDPVLLTDDFGAISEVVRDPVPTGTLTETLLRTLCYVVIGYSLALARMATKDS